MTLFRPDISKKGKIIDANKAKHDEAEQAHIDSKQAYDDVVAQQTVDIAGVKANEIGVPKKWNDVNNHEKEWKITTKLSNSL